MRDRIVRRPRRGYLNGLERDDDPVEKIGVQVGMEMGTGGWSLQRWREPIGSAGRCAMCNDGSQSVSSLPNYALQEGARPGKLLVISISAAVAGVRYSSFRKFERQEGDYVAAIFDVLSGPSDRHPYVGKWQR